MTSSGISHCSLTQQTYSPPEWAQTLSLIPQTRLKLAQLPTPIHPWSLPGLPDGFQLFIKRDDLTGSALSGNKVRKLEFILSEGLRDKCNVMITGGGLQSNHARTTAVASREVGMDSHLILYTYDQKQAQENVRGNLLLCKLTGACIGTIPPIPSDKRLQAYDDIFSNTQNLLNGQGYNAQSMRLGGATPLGCWGYIEAFKEMIEQGIFDNIDDVVVCLATGGTGCGLMIANYMTGSKIKLHGVCIKYTKQTLAGNMDKEIEHVGLRDEHGSLVRSSELIDMIDHTSTHPALTQDDMKYLIEVSTQTGIVLDTTFTLPAVVGMMREMRENPGRFKGHRVLFIHTGGLYEMQSVEMDEMLLTTPETNRVYTIDNFIDIN